MKKKAGQAPGAGRSPEVRNTSLVPINNTSSGAGIAVSKSEASKSGPVIEETTYEEFDYKSLGKMDVTAPVNSAPKITRSSGSSKSSSKSSASSKSVSTTKNAPKRGRRYKTP